MKYQKQAAKNMTVIEQEILFFLKFVPHLVN